MDRGMDSWTDGNTNTVMSIDNIYIYIYIVLFNQSFIVCMFSMEQGTQLHIWWYWYTGDHMPLISTSCPGSCIWAVPWLFMVWLCAFFLRINSRSFFFIFTTWYISHRNRPSPCGLSWLSIHSSCFGQIIIIYCWIDDSFSNECFICNYDPFFFKCPLFHLLQIVFNLETPTNLCGHSNPTN